MKSKPLALPSASSAVSHTLSLLSIFDSDSDSDSTCGLAQEAATRPCHVTQAPEALHATPQSPMRSHGTPKQEVNRRHRDDTHTPAWSLTAPIARAARPPRPLGA